MNTLQKLAQQTAQILQFDSQFKPRVESLITSLESLSLTSMVAEDDSRVVKAHKNARLKKVNHILNRAINDIKKSLVESDGTLTESSDESLVDETTAEDNEEVGAE